MTLTESIQALITADDATGILELITYENVQVKKHEERAIIAADKLVAYQIAAAPGELSLEDSEALRLELIAKFAGTIHSNRIK